MIEFIDAHKQYGTTAAVDSISLQVHQGELCVLLGPSGCGKTTLLRMVNRLVEPSSGRILVNGRDISRENPVMLRRSIGYAIQSVGLFPHRTVAENIAITPTLLGLPKGAIAERVDEMLALVKLDPGRYRNRYPAQLSGGEAQRVGVARALAADPPLLLMDEPFGAIDPINRTAIQDEFLELQRRLRKTILFVSHDIREALHLADRLVLMRAGRIEQEGSPADLLARPASEFVAQFFGASRRTLLLDAIRADAALDPDAPPPSTQSSIAADAPLHEALLALLASGEESICVTTTDGTAASITLGALTLRSIQQRIALSLAEENME